MTFYESSEILPDFRDYSMKDRTYRFTTENVLYPFGFGLTYGTIHFSAVDYKDGKVWVTLSNEKNSVLEDVVQLYIKDESEFAVPNVSLCAFKRIRLEPKEQLTLQFSLSERAFTSVNENGERRVFGSSFTLYAGNCQPTELSRTLGGEWVRTHIELSREN